MILSEAAIPPGTSDSRFSQVDVCLGLSLGLPSAGLPARVVPAGVSVGPSPLIANFLKMFIIHLGEGSPLGIVSACPLVSKAGSGCVWEAGL